MNFLVCDFRSSRAHVAALGHRETSEAVRSGLVGKQANAMASPSRLRVVRVRVVYCEMCSAVVDVMEPWCSRGLRDDSDYEVLERHLD
jgi:hypothetical protein